MSPAAAEPATPSGPGRGPSATGGLAAVRAWWCEPRLTWWFVVLVAALLALRKPWALHTPQLHAEDGTIFLTQNDGWGAVAIVRPYMGYLLLLPRLIAWTASHVADVAWWPAIYNGAAFAIAVAMIARLASPRLAVPGKPWLALAFAFVAHTGEVFFTITNLHWLTAFFLLQHVLMARPATWRQRGVDLAILGLVGLTGPFSIVFLPLFAWRAWRDRHGDALAALLVVAACAGVQAWFVVTTGVRFDYQSLPFHPGMFFAVVGARLVTWSVLGAGGALALPVAALAAIGGGFVLALLVWALRPGPLRAVRAPIVAAFVLILASVVYRLRPDTWDMPNIVNGDRYFYVPRVLLAWLLIWEFNAAPQAIAWAARALCLVGALANLPHYVLPAPRDYHWAQRCEPIRRGVSADIPTLPEGWTLEYRGRPAPK